MSKADQDKQSPQQITIPLEWHVPDHISSRYADNVVVQPRKHDIIISFFESQPPPLGAFTGRFLKKQARRQINLL